MANSESKAVTSPITTRGRYFYKSQTRFFVRGIVYQPRLRTDGVDRPDPLDPSRLPTLRQAIPLLQDLGLNTITIYSVDNTVDHTEAMSLLAAAGIYVVVGLSTPKRAINRTAPLASYTAELVEEYLRTVDNMSEYVNTLAFCAANSVVNNTTTSRAAEVVRSVVRDVKRYVRLRADLAGQRVVPVGVHLAGAIAVRRPSVEYFTAGVEPERVDYLGFNDYSWSGSSNMSISGWDRLVELVEGLGLKIPCFLSEYGGKVHEGTRTFDEVRALFAPEMKGVFSGGALYEFFAGPNGYGIVREDENYDGLEKLGEFENFRVRTMDVQRWEGDEEKEEERGKLKSNEEGGVGGLEIGSFPDLSDAWKASSQILQSPLDWEQIEARISSPAGEEVVVKLGE